MQSGAVLSQSELGPDLGALREYAQAVQDLDYDFLVTSDHLVGADPADHPELERVFSIDSYLREPLMLGAFLAAAAPRLGYLISVIILPQRQTVLAAKQARPGRASASSTLATTGTSTTCRCTPSHSRSRTRRSPSPSPVLKRFGWAASHGYAMLSSGLGTPLATTANNRDLYVNGLRDSGYSQTDIDRLLNRWVVTKHVYVAPTDAEALAEAREPQMWYRDSFIRSMSAEGLAALHESVYRGAEATIARLSAQTWESLVEDALIIGSPETVASKIALLEQHSVGELVCWMNFGGLPPDKVRRSMRLFALEVIPRFRAKATQCTLVESPGEVA